MVMLRMEVAGEAIVSRAISRFADHAGDLREPFRNIADDFLEVEREQFASEGSQSTGGRWQPLSPAYAAWKAQAFPGMPIMRRTDRLFLSLTTRNSDHIEIVQPEQLTLGSRVEYGIYHQRYTSNLPQRRVIALNDQIRTRWMKMIQAYLVAEARRAGL